MDGTLWIAILASLFVILYSYGYLTRRGDDEGGDDQRTDSDRGDRDVG